MFTKKTVRLAAVLVGFALIFVSAAVLANGAEQPAPATEEEAATPPAPAEQPEATMPPPAGRGPAEIAAGISVAPISAIQQRGHVENSCEALAMTKQLIQQNGKQQTFGDYQVAYMLDAPKGWYEVQDGKLTWRPPAPGETQHIEAIVMDSMTGQLLPVQQLTLDVVDAQGAVVQSQQLQYYWHPMAAHYGANYSIPTAGMYTLRIQSPIPDFRRHDRNMGDRFTTALNASFTEVSISPKAPADTPGTAATETATPPAGAGPTETATPADEHHTAEPATPSEQPLPPAEQPAQPSPPAEQPAQPEQTQ